MAINDQKDARRARFENVFAKIRDELIEHFKKEGMPSEAVEWYTNVGVFPFQLVMTFSLPGQNLNYNVPGGKLNRGMSVVDTVEILKSRELTEDEYFKAAVLGWCIELVSNISIIAPISRLTHIH